MAYATIWEPGARILAVAYVECLNKPMREAAYLTGFNKASVSRMVQKAKDRGFDRHQNPCIVTIEHIQDARCSGRPLKLVTLLI